MRKGKEKKGKIRKKKKKIKVNGTDRMYEKVRSYCEMCP